jgi:mono/diheme cytochrome c family protein/glucose/arabinose dehydrogenase
MKPFAALAAAALSSSLLFAQNGDKAGEVQKETVPADKIPPAPVLSPEEEAKTFRLPAGFRVELVAAEPLVHSPVQAQFDHLGRLWVVEMNGYMPDLEGSGEQEPNGNIVILEDTDGDGRMDRRTGFLDRLVMPRSVMLVGGGALVAEPPVVWFARDTDGDGKADEKIEAFADYATQDAPRLGAKANPEHASNGLLWALDNWIYSANHTFRYRWTGEADSWLKEPTIFRGQWGLTQDDTGRLHFNSNSDPHRADFVPSHYLARNPNLRPAYGANVQVQRDMKVWTARVNPGVNRGYQPNQLTPEGKLATFTGACGPVVYRGDQLGADCAGNVFLCEPAGNFIRRHKITEKDGEFTVANAHPESEFLAALDERFRPVNLMNGPDGSLYVVDLYRGLIQHRIYLTSYLRKQVESRKLQSSVDLGRIWRVVRTDQPVNRTDKLPAKPSTAELIARLSHANGFWRDTAQRLLVERNDPVATASLKELVRNPGTATALGRLHALWTLDGLSALDLPTLQAASADADGRVRSAALRLAEGFFNGPSREDALNLVYQRAGFIPPAEQTQLLFTLGQIRTSQADNIIKVLLLNMPPSRLRFDAAISGLGGRELEFLEGMVGDPACATMRDSHAPLLGGLARCVTQEGDPARIAQLLNLATRGTPGNWQAAALLDGIAGTVPVAKAGQPAPKLIRLEAEPKAFAKLRDIADEGFRKQFARLDAVLGWPDKPGLPPQPTARPLTADERASFVRGKEVYALVCAACHQPHGWGQEGLAPVLRDAEWPLGPEGRAIRIVLHGVRDELTVKGAKWNSNMPAFGEAISDQQIADVLTYLRREWGHLADPVTEAAVKSVRTATAGREDSWTEAELLKLH